MLQKLIIMSISFHRYRRACCRPLGAMLPDALNTQLQPSQMGLGQGWATFFFQRAIPTYKNTHKVPKIGQWHRNIKHILLNYVKLNLNTKCSDEGRKDHANINYS